MSVTALGTDFDLDRIASFNETPPLLPANLTHRPDAGDGEKENIIRYYVEGVCLISLSAVGIAANVVAVVVLSRPKMVAVSFNRLLIALAVADAVYLVFSISIFSLPTLSPEHLERWLQPAMPFSFGIAHVGRVASVYLTVAVTLER